MFWRLFVKDTPLLDSALEGIVFKEGKGRFYGRFRKKRLLAYDEVAKCLRYYTPQRVLKGTIHLHDILFITPGRSSGRDVRKDSVFEITVPGRIYVFHVNNIRETKKWIGILSRELDNLQIKDRIQLNNGNLIEGTYSKTLRPNSAVLSSLRIGDHREHEECCFLFDEEHQHKIIALESLCSLQAMKIYELSHSVDKIQKKCDAMEVPPNDEIRQLKRQFKDLRVTFELEKLKVLDLQAKVEEEELRKASEQDKGLVRKVEKHHHVDFVSTVKVMRVEKGEASTKPPISSQKKNIISSPSFVNIPGTTSTTTSSTSDKNRMEEIKKLQEELEQTRTLLAYERSRALDPFRSVDFNTSTSASPSPVLFDTRSTTPATPNRSPSVLPRSGSVISKLDTIHENPTLHSKASSGNYRTFSPVLTNPYIEHHTNPNYTREPSPKPSGSSNPSSSPQQLRRQNTDSSTILSPQPQYPQPMQLEPAFIQSPMTNSFESAHLLDAPIEPQTALDTLPNGKQKISLRNSNGITPKFGGQVKVEKKSTLTITTVETEILQSSGNTLRQDFNLREATSDPIPIIKPRSYSESGGQAPYKTVTRTNGKLATSDNDIETTISPRSRTASNPPPFKPSSFNTGSFGSSPKKPADSFSSKFASEVSELLSSPPDDNGWAVQVVAKLNEAIAEIANLSVLLQVEREKVKNLTDEKSHMLDTMEDMTRERTRAQKYRDEMEELLESKEGKIRALQEALNFQTQPRRNTEPARQNHLFSGQATLRSIGVDDEMPSNAGILQPLLTNYSH